jgi:hypothetical protein
LGNCEWVEAREFVEWSLTQHIQEAKIFGQRTVNIKTGFLDGRKLNDAQSTDQFFSQKSTRKQDRGLTK